MNDDLETRVLQFRMLALPGQPMSMHVGTGDLVNDLWKENERLRAERDRAAPTLPSVPAGWQLVPVEPTDEMIYAATSEMIYKTEPHTLRIWYAMLASAPKPEDV